MRRRSDGGGGGGRGGGGAGSQRAKTKTPHKDVGNYRKTMGKLGFTLENHGKMEIYFGKPWENEGLAWKTMGKWRFSLW